MRYEVWGEGWLSAIAAKAKKCSIAEVYLRDSPEQAQVIAEAPISVW